MKGNLPWWIWLLVVCEWVLLLSALWILGGILLEHYIDLYRRNHAQRRGEDKQRPSQPNNLTRLDVSLPGENGQDAGHASERGRENFTAAGRVVVNGNLMQRLQLFLKRTLQSSRRNRVRPGVIKPVAR